MNLSSDAVIFCYLPSDVSELSHLTCAIQLSCEVDVFTARRYASALYDVVVCPSVRLSQAGTVPKWPIAGSRKQCI